MNKNKYSELNLGGVFLPQVECFGLTHDYWWELEYKHSHYKMVWTGLDLFSVDSVNEKGARGAEPPLDFGSTYNHISIN